MKKLLPFLFLNFIFINSPAQSYDWAVTSCPSSVSRFDDMSFINSQKGWVIDFMGGLYSTDNGGFSWTTLNGPPSNVYRSVLFLDSLKGFIGLLGKSNPDSTILYTTDNGGSTWTPVNSLPMPNGNKNGICGMCKVEDSVIYACGRFWGEPHVYKSVDYGSNWQRFDFSNPAFGLVDIYFWSKDSGIVVGSVDTSGNAVYANAAIYRTTDGGLNWQIVYQSQMQEEWCWKISVPESGKFYVSVEQLTPGPRYIIKSLDYGLSWNEIQYSFATASPIVCQGIGFRTANEGWVAINSTSAINNSFFHTYDGGATWIPQNVEWGINRFRILNDSIGFASGLHVFKMTDLTQGVIESKRKVMTISPVLTTGLITITFQDELKKEITILSCDGLLAGKYQTAAVEYSLDLSMLRAGAYFILASSDYFYTSEKILLMK